MKWIAGIRRQFWCPNGSDGLDQGIESLLTESETSLLEWILAVLLEIKILTVENLAQLNKLPPTPAVVG